MYLLQQFLLAPGKDLAKENMFLYREMPPFHSNLSLQGYCTAYLGNTGIRHSPVNEAGEANWMSDFKQIKICSDGKWKRRSERQFNELSVRQHITKMIHPNPLKHKLCFYPGKGLVFQMHFQLEILTAYH